MGHELTDMEWRYSFNLGAKWGGCQRHALTALPPGKETRWPLQRRLGGSRCRSGRMRKMSPPSRFDPRSAQPVASRITD
jgi:hypothetical protein